MKIVKQCAYCGHVYNVLPTILVTPLYSVTEYETPAPTTDIKPGAAYPKDYWMRRGFRVALKFWRWHLGWEVHYE